MPANQTPPQVVVYKMPWTNIILMGFLMELGVLAAPLAIAALGWNILFVILAFGGWTAIQVIINVLLGVIALGYLRKWLVPRSGAIVAVTIVGVTLAQLMLLTEGNVLHDIGKTIPDRVLVGAVLLGGPLLAVVTAFIGTRVSLRRSA